MASTCLDNQSGGTGAHSHEAFQVSDPLQEAAGGAGHQEPDREPKEHLENRGLELWQRRHVSKNVTGEVQFLIEPGKSDKGEEAHALIYKNLRQH